MLKQQLRPWCSLRPTHIADAGAVYREAGEGADLQQSKQLTCPYRNSWNRLAVASSRQIIMLPEVGMAGV